MSTAYRLPEGFVWGTATSSYQIEGAASDGGRGPSIWDTFTASEGAVKDRSDGSVACDHWNRWPHDVGLMRELGVSAYRLSISWPRVFPTGLERRPIQDGLDVYERMVDALLAAGIDPWVTLYHWDLPQGLEDLGGWPDRRLVDRFIEFSVAVADRLGDRVQHWITHNEPWCIAHLGYGIGAHAPGRRDLAASLAAAHHVLLSHGQAVTALRQRLPSTARIGLTLNLTPASPASGSEADTRAAVRFDGFFNRWYLHPILGRGYPDDMLAFYASSELIDGSGSPDWLQDGDLDAIAAPIDFLGVNYYTRAIVRDRDAVVNDLRTIREPGRDQRTAMGWEVYPDGLYRLLTRLQAEAPGLPLVVTENGAAYDAEPDDEGRVSDPARVAYLRQHLRACARAIQHGADLRGFFAWSFLDNFEWHDGYTQRFGLVHVDFATQRRTPKQSFHWFRRVATNNVVPDDNDAFNDAHDLA